ncbi:Pmp3 family protein [Acinetobacter sp. WCHAc060025]|jgi:RNA polymerase subunit RPABC4/transcription elongation factor Spt4|uniref:Pmp3 family protein n=1 Tax=Acinetobacter sp. WCHAc060025 TaxID=2518625 RepID=UPI001023E377|nr:Pmp3 family protein [Acinetobacter sp. WCHAc060025]RZG71685.1 Pmp3 family protein [Acinetobacter sp. WCHAc060025]
MAIVYCNKCKQCGESKLKGSGWITFILILFYIIPGLIYMIWRRSGLGECKFCGSSDVIPVSQKPIENNQQKIAMNQPLFENVPHINCPDCRELIRFDARKCKHCGSFIDQQNK